MYAERENIFYYLTVENEDYPMPPMPEGAEEGIIRGMYRLEPASRKRSRLKAHLFASGPIVNRALEARKILETSYNVAADVWSITSFKELYRNGNQVERWNRMHPGEAPRSTYIQECLEGEKGVCVIASDYVKALPDSISRWFPGKPVSLGTDGFGRSESREALRDFFEVDARFIVLGALSALLRDGKVEPEVVGKAMEDMDIDRDKADALFC